jgi:hypothetical protein
MKRHLNQSIPLLLCPMFRSLKKVLAASPRSYRSRPRGEQRVVASARQPEQLFDLHATMNAVIFFISTMEPLTRASNLPYLPFWQNAFSAEKVAEMGRANGVY